MIAVFIKQITITIIHANTTFHTVSCRVGGEPWCSGPSIHRTWISEGDVESNKSVLKDNFVAIQIKDSKKKGGADPGRERSKPTHRVYFRGGGDQGDFGEILVNG